MSIQNVQPLAVTYDRTDLFDAALKRESERGHYSRCYFGNKAKIAGAESDDPGWYGVKARFLTDRGVVHFTYGGYAFEQHLTAADIAWTDRFDTGKEVRNRTILLDPQGPATRLLHKVGTAKPHHRPVARPKAEARLQDSITGSELMDGRELVDGRGTGALPPMGEAPASGEPAAATPTTHGSTGGCNSHMGGNSRRARRMQILVQNAITQAGKAEITR